MSLISSLLTVVNPGGRPQPERPYITPLDVYNNDKNIRGGKRYFQYWPEDIQVNKHVNWETKNIPGLSHPLYQWISGGSREITFTAVFTADQAPSQAVLDILNNIQTGTVGIGNIPSLSAFIQTGTVGNIPSLSALTSGSLSVFSDPRNVDIPSAIQWLESYLYPEYTADGISGIRSTPLPRPKPPRKMLLGLPGMRLGQRSSLGTNDEIVCIMLQCEVTYSAFFANGTPRIAKASMQFAEIIQVYNKINVQDAFALRTAGNFGYKLTTGPSDKKR